MRRRITALMFACLLPGLACSTPTPYQPISEASRALLGTIGVTTLRVDLSGQIAAPAAGWLAGMGAGTRRGFGVMFEGTAVGALEGAASGSALAVFVGAALGAACGVVYLPFSMASGAMTALSPEEAAAAQANLDAGLREFDLTGRVQGQLLEFAQTEARVDCVDLGYVDTPFQVASEILPLAVPGARGCQSIARLEIVGLPAGSHEGVFSVNTPYSMALVARLRVHLKPSNHMVYDERIVYHIPAIEHRFIEWAADDARRLVEYLERGTEMIAERFVEELLLRHYPHAPSRWRIGW